MNFENLRIDRIIAHEVFRRNDDRLVVEPHFGSELTVFEEEALGALSDRLAEALGSASRSMEMTIQDSTDQSAVAIANDLLSSPDDQTFIQISRRAADKLANAQTSRGFPGGVLVIVQGTVGFPECPIIALIKAELQSGFLKKFEDGAITVEFLSQLFLTPQAKLYKIGAFVSVPVNGVPAWKAFVFDVSMTPGNKLTAAQYFYNGFVGCVFPHDAARATRAFHELTREFIDSSTLSSERKVELHNALVTYLKVDNTPTVQVNEFSERYLNPPALRDSFNDFMTGKGFTAQPIEKDISDLGLSLRFRRVIFSRDVKLTAPAELFERMVEIEEIDGEQGADGQIPRWTKVIIKSQIESQS